MQEELEEAARDARRSKIVSAPLSSVPFTYTPAPGQQVTIQSASYVATIKRDTLANKAHLGLQQQLSAVDRNLNYVAQSNLPNNSRTEDIGIHGKHGYDKIGVGSLHNSMKRKENLNREQSEYLNRQNVAMEEQHYWAPQNIAQNLNEPGHFSRIQDDDEIRIGDSALSVAGRRMTVSSRTHLDSQLHSTNGDSPAFYNFNNQLYYTTSECPTHFSNQLHHTNSTLIRKTLNRAHDTSTLPRSAVSSPTTVAAR